MGGKYFSLLKMATITVVKFYA